jgi:hypothetical protein
LRFPLRSLLVLIVTLSLTASASAASAKAVPRLIFPVVGSAAYHDDFGEPRAGGSHQGNDILAERRAPAVAAEAGTVKFWTTSATAGCMLYLYGDSGTTYLYIHLNNDLTSKNDNRGSCVAGTAYAPGLKSGAHVGAGQLVGYVGDSGDANGIHPHLHFEVHPNDGGAVDPYPYLRKAQPLIYFARAGAKVSLSVSGTIVAASPLDGTLAVKASSVQANASPAVEVTRKIVLTLASDVYVTGDFGLELDLESLLPGLPATVTTLPVKTTLATQRGDANVLTASRISLGD